MEVVQETDGSSDVSVSHDVGATWRANLLDGVTVLPKFGEPGRVVVYGDRAEPILTGTSEGDVLLAAAELGQGRVAAFAHDAYLSKFFDAIPQTTNENLDKFLTNLKCWITKGNFQSHADFIKASTFDSTKHQLGSFKAVVWNGGRETIPSADLLEYIEGGGGFIHNMTPWGWLQLNPWKSLTDMPYWNIMITAGMYYTDDTIRAPATGFEVSSNKAANAHLLRSLALLSIDFDIAIEKVSVMKGLDHLPADYRRRITELLTPLWMVCCDKLNGGGCCPSATRVVSDRKERGLLELWYACFEVQQLLGIKAPGCCNFPGDYESCPQLKCGVVEITSTIAQTHPTGYYAPAGQTIKVMVEGEAKNWTIQIGAHTDDLSTKTEWRRWPHVITSYNLKTGDSVELSSPFGGLIYLKSSTGRNDIKVQLTDVVDAPRFKLSDGEAAVTNWTSSRQNPGLWADISGIHVTITVPSSSVRNIDDPSAVMRLWDQVVILYHELRGTDIGASQHQWIVADEQPSAGYMHAGHPVVTHLDVASPSNKEFLLNAINLKTTGYWGPFHELGHNMQRSEWTFDGTGEVTVNIFTLFAMESLCGHAPWIHSWLKDQLNEVRKYLADGAIFAQWKQKPGVALFVYAQLARAFGWDAYKKVFRIYETMVKNERPKSNQDKMDAWFFQFSKAVQFNLCPLASFWSIPLTDGGVEKISALQHQAFLPDDELTAHVPDRVTGLIAKFPGLTRTTGVSSCSEQS